jgi:hypothetical protein
MNEDVNCDNPSPILDTPGGYNVLNAESDLDYTTTDAWIDMRNIILNQMPSISECVSPIIHWSESQDATDFTVTTTNNTSAGEAWVDMEFMRRNGINAATEACEPSTPFTLLRDTVQEILNEFNDPIDPQSEFETSSPLRAEDDQDDTLGQQYDDGVEMSEAEIWFRDKIRVR